MGANGGSHDGGVMIREAGQRKGRGTGVFWGLPWMVGGYKNAEGVVHPTLSHIWKMLYCVADGPGGRRCA